jgi:hypothetical protein
LRDVWKPAFQTRRNDMALIKAVRSLTFAAALIAPLAVQPAAQAQIGIGIGISVHIAPPALPVYVQPPIPEEGYLWNPGYWAYGDAGYYWVPGVWVRPPSVGVLWTPPYWGFAGGVYGFHAGYWGPHVGFYGGVNYGFGFGGIGFCGGEWRGGRFAYNGAVANFGGVHVTNVYRDTAIVNRTTIVNVNHTSFNGPGGVVREPSPQEQQFSHENHIPPTANQQQHFQAAAQDRSQLASVNGGRPGTPAASNPGAYHQVAQQHAASQPISAADKSAGKSYAPNARMANQDQRIANGERSGQMTSGEAAKATAQQSRIDSQVHNDRAANGGTLTGQEKQQVNREQNNVSKNIYDDKHNANTVKPNAVDDREANQQDRTAQGLRSGQETAGEAGKTNARQAGVDKEVHNDRTANGGALNQQQKQQVNKQQNHNSKQIANQKHNNNSRPAPPKEGKGKGR